MHNIPVRATVFACVTCFAAGAACAQTDLCGFIKKVVADRSAEFTKFKGDQDTVMGNVPGFYHGSLTPTPLTTCTLQVWRKPVGRAAELSAYACDIAVNMSDDEAETRYADSAAQIRACLPNWTFSKTVKGAARMGLMATEPGAVVSLDTYDAGLIEASVYGTPPPPASVTLSLTIEDTAPRP